MISQALSSGTRNLNINDMTTSKLIARSIAEKAILAQQEMDELAVQLALGKAEARDKFEEMKKDLRKNVQTWKKTIGKINTESQSAWSELESRLNLGAAIDRKVFDEQYRKIMDTLQILEKEVADRWPDFKTPEEILHELEKFKLKMEILRLKFSLKKFEVKDDFRSKMSTITDTIESITRRTERKLKAGKSKYTDIKDELKIAYQHVRKALKSF